MPRAEPKAPKPINNYGLPIAPPERHSQLYYERLAFRLKWPIEKGGLPRYEHFRNGCKILWPWLEWNPWMERQAEAFCNNQWVGVAGCAGSCKTTVAVIYGVFWWLCGIHDSAFVLTSTTKGDIRKRAWFWVQKLYTSIEGPRIGNMVDSRTTWQGTKGDDRHCVTAIAVREGSVNKAVARIQGFHPDRLLICVDEATDTPEAIFEAFPNLISTPWDFGVIVDGNPASRFDPMGKFCEPAGGYGSITVEDEEWESVPQLNGKPGLILHFDSEKSPNVLSGTVQYKHLPKGPQVEAIRKRMGAESPGFYKFWRGFWCPEGIIQTVLTESMLARCQAVGATSKFLFLGGPVFTIAFLDPAFGGGDKAVLRFAKCAEIEGGATGIQLVKTQKINVSVKSAVPIHFQISQQVIWHCKEMGVEARCFGLDSTGEGGGLADIIARDWESSIARVEFGGKPSEKRVSHEDERPCDEVYDRKVTELHFTVKEFVAAGQLKGMNSDEAKDLCNRLWRFKGKKMEIEPKTKRKSMGDAEETGNWGFKERMGRSPDDGDALCGLCAVARRVGVAIKTQGRTARSGDDWLKVAQKHDEIYGDGTEEAHEWPAAGGVRDDFAIEDV